MLPPTSVAVNETLRFMRTDSKDDDLVRLVCRDHYLHCMPARPTFCYAVVDTAQREFFGCRSNMQVAITFSPPAGWRHPVLELTRLVRTAEFAVPLTKILALTYQDLRRERVPLLVSLADLAQQHHGGIYQAASWHYGGLREPRLIGYYIDGRYYPQRSCNRLFNSSSGTLYWKLWRKYGYKVQARYDQGKHLYWKPLGRQGEKLAAEIGLQKLPYPTILAPSSRRKA